MSTNDDNIREGAPQSGPDGPPPLPADYIDRLHRRRDRDIERPTPLGDDAGMRMLLPVGRSGWAIASGYLGLLSVLFVPAPFALITGILAIRDIRKHKEKHGMGRAIFGIIMGAFFTIGLIGGALAISFDKRR